jgi:hypothetical protein
MDFLETPDLYGNVIKNNRIVWKNVSVVDLLPGKYMTDYVTVGNYGKEKGIMKIEFGKKRSYGDMFLNHGTVKIIVADSLAKKLIKGKVKINGLRLIKKNIFLVTNPGASIDGFLLAPNELHTLGISFEWKKKSWEKVTKGCYFDVVQSNMNKIAGGQTFYIKRKR